VRTLQMRFTFDAPSFGSPEQEKQTGESSAVRA
jgi:hypothetical protein